MWYPGATAPDYLDGSMAGDYGFDPLRLGANKESLPYLQEAELMSGPMGDVLGDYRRLGGFEPSLPKFGKRARRITTLTLRRWSSRKLSLWVFWKR